MPLHVATIKAIINQEKQQKGFLISDHMYRHILEVSDNLYVINNGKTNPASNLADLKDLGYLRP